MPQDNMAPAECGTLGTTTDLDSPQGRTPFRFSVIVLTHNSTEHIRRLLDCLAGQTLDFTSCIQVIVADTNPMDRTLDNVTSWSARYPDNVRLVRPQISGTTVAYNHAVMKAEGEWVAFIDAEDLVAPSFFQELDSFLSHTAFTGHVVSCNVVPMSTPENVGAYQHEFAYRFTESRVVDLLEAPDDFPTTLHSCVFRLSALRQFGLQCDERVPQTFSQTHMLYGFLLATRNFSLAFVQGALYLECRNGRRSMRDATSWTSAGRYLDVPFYGFLDVLRQHSRLLGQVPTFVQNLVLYHCQLYVTRLLGDNIPCELTEEQHKNFFDLLSLVFQHIDTRQILLSSLPRLEPRTRIAMLCAFKNSSFFGMPFIVTEISPRGDEAQLLHWATGEATYGLDGEGHDIAITWEKRIVHAYRGRPLCHEYHCWVPLNTGQPICPKVAETNPGIFCRGKILETLDREMVLQSFRLPRTSLSAKQQNYLNMGLDNNGERFRNCWVLMDRTDKADDNAEHLCRWMMRNHPEQPVHFVLDARSKDWNRLQREGFPLLAYGSTEHYQALGRATWLVSSHVDGPVIDPMQTRELFGAPQYKFAFLQHGITKEDVSSWLNSIPLDFFVCSAKPEYDSILGGNYKFTERELSLTGFPRHDPLLQKAQKHKPGRVLLVCPTWRERLMRHAMNGLSPAEAAEVFRQSNYYKAWNSLVSSRRIARLLAKHEFKMLFLPHPETERFLPIFKPSGVCTVLRWGDVNSVQDLLASSAIAVTDYSSLAFDIAYINRPLAYYQFQETPSYLDQQSRRAGYFIYERDGFGPVIHTEEKLEKWLDEMLTQGVANQAPYKDRVTDFYPQRDGDNCRRVYESIIARS